MSFSYNYTDYGVSGLPVIKDDTIPYTEYNANTTINNLTYSYKTCTIFDYKMNNHISSVKFPKTYNTVLYALKSKKEDGLYKYYQIMTTSPYFGFIGGFTDTLGVMTQGIISQNVNVTDETYIGIIETEDFLILGHTTSVRGTIYLNGIGIQKVFLRFVLNEIEGENTDPDYGPASEPEGYEPEPDPISEEIPLPDTPPIGVTNVGFVNVYKTSLNALQNLGSELFPNFTPPEAYEVGDSIPEMIAYGFNNLTANISNILNSYINSNLINYIIDCHVIPISPPTSGSENIKIGFKSFNSSGAKVTSDYIDFDCGTISIKEYYGNFIDYVGTRAQLFLPFIGFVPIKNEYFQSGSLQVKYRFNIIDGSFMAFVISTSSKSQLANSIVGMYGGNACVHIPITGVNYSNMISGVLNGITSTVSNSGASADVANSALGTLAVKPTMESSNGYNATSSFLGIRYPYLIIEREVSNFSEYYPNEDGLPCNITKAIKELSGYIEMDNIHMETLTCTDDEKTLIENLLKSGIVI